MADIGINAQGRVHKVYDNRIREPGFDVIEANQLSKFVILHSFFYLSIINEEGLDTKNNKRHDLFDDDDDEDRELNYIVIEPKGAIQQLDKSDYKLYINGKLNFKETII